ncbi:MAG: N-acetylornithine carbamoyltransferase [Planctomycetota bacterium]|nr:N-acetylornithine carbamoyltransferase [Planctomycetota bacterium]
MATQIDIRGRDVVTLDTFSAEEIRAITARARALKDAPPGTPLAGHSLAMVFFEPSLRTRASFAIAFGSLGGTVIDLVAGRDLWPLEMREGAVMDDLADEHVRDAARVLSEYADVIAIRALAHQGDWAQARRDTIIVSFQKHAGVPIFNMESVLDHPCQAWGDALTIEEALGEPRGRKIALVWTYHPKAKPLAVPHGVGVMATKLGMDLTVARPPGYDFDPSMLQTMRHAADSSGGSIRFVEDSAEAVENADVVYAASWGSIDLHADRDAERALRDGHRDRRITSALMASTDGARFMHAMPVRRNVEADDAVIDAPGSLVVQQAGNRLHIQRALFRGVLGV